MPSTIHTLPPSPSGQATHFADSPIINRPPTPLSPSRSTPSGSNGGFGNDPQMMSALGTGGVVRRKPARRANTAERRATHNAVERQRRETLNSRFLDLAALLPNLVSVRRPSKSAIVNSSIAIIHTQRRLRALAAHELRVLNAEAHGLRQEVNEWRKTHPSSPIAGASPAPVEEPARSADFIALIELEDVPEDEMEMNEAERIAYEMRGGEGGTMYGEDGDGDDLGDEDLSDGQRQQVHQQPTPAPSVASQAARPSRVRDQSFSTSIGHNVQTQPSGQAPQHQSSQPPVIDAQHQQLSAQYHAQHTEPAQHQLIPQQQIGFPGSFLPPTFDAIAAAAAGFPSGAPLAEADAAKFAAWNAHFYSALAAQQQQQQVSQQQQQWAAAMQFQNTSNTSHGSPGMFGSTQQPSQANPFLAHFQRASNTSNVFAAGMKGMEESNTSSSPSTQSFASSTFGNDAPPSSSARSSTVPNTSTSSVPSLGLSGVTSAGSPSSTATSSIPFNLGSDPFGTGVNFSYGPASAGSNWTNPDSRSTSSTPGLGGLSHHSQAVSVGGGGGGSHTSYAMMSMFI